MKKLLAIFVLLSLAVAPLVAQTTPEKSINIIASSLRPVHTDALTGVNIDPIQTDMSNRPCARIKMRVNRMTKAEIAALEIKIIGGNAQVIRRMVADDGNGLIFEVTARENLRFYIQHPEFGESNDVQLAVEGNKEYYLDAELNQLFTITIVSNTADAEVYIDDKFVGRTQKSGSDYLCTVKDALPGEHKLHLKYGGMTTAVQSINVNSASSLFYRQNVNIAGSKPQFVVIEVEPKNAVVTIDSQPYVPEDGIVQAILENGTHNYSVVARGYHSQQGVITVEGQKIMQKIALKSDSVTVTLTATDADIYINNKMVGNGTWSGTLVSGLYIFEARREGYRTQTISQNVTSAQPQQTYAFKPLEPIYGSLTITTTPAIATVTIDDKDVGTTPLQLDNVLIGSRKITLSKEGYASATYNVNIAEGKSEQIVASLKKYDTDAKPASNEIWYTNGSTTEATTPHNRTFWLGYFQRKIISNTYNPEKRCWIIKLSGNITKIQDGAFLDCNDLQSVTIPDGVTEIESFAFGRCKNLKTITIPDSVTSIEDYAFNFCENLTSINIPNSVTSIGNSTFAMCRGLTSVIIPDSVTSIGVSAFLDCISLTNVTIPDSVKSIEIDAFSCCTKLTSVTIPESVTSIGENAFHWCKSLTTLYCKPTTPPTDVKVCIIDKDSDCKIYVPSGSLKAYKKAWRANAKQIFGYDF